MCVWVCVYFKNYFLNQKRKIMVCLDWKGKKKALNLKQKQVKSN